MVIFINGSLNVLNYFMENMIDGLEDVVVLDISKTDYRNKLIELDPYINETTKVITFNNIYIDIRVNGELYWDYKKVKLYNILVDPPQYFTDALDLHMKSMIVVVVDRDHYEFVRKYYSDLRCMFLPHGGVCLEDKEKEYKEIPYNERKQDVVYIAYNKINGPLESDMEQLIYNLLLKFPHLTVDKVFELILNDQDQHLESEQEKRMLAGLYINTFYSVKEYFQKKILQMIADAGINLHIYGGGWDMVADQYPENVTVHGEISPKECIQIMRESKIVLNMQPWFKDGAHERIFNAMLNGAVCLSDESKYLKERFTDMENIVFYQLDHLDELGNKIKILLENPELAQTIISNQKKAVVHDRWADRMDEILAHDGVE